MNDDTTIKGDVPQRTISNGIFPFSARANARAGIFSDVLAAVMGCEPQATFEDEFKRQFLNLDIDDIKLENDAKAEQVWEVYKEKYTSETRGGSLIATPFNVEVPKRIKPASSMQWGKWYQIHMTKGPKDSLSFADELHQDFKDELDSKAPSNIFEEVILEVVNTLEDPDQAPQDKTEPLRPYIPAMAENFTVDLRAWINNNLESPSDWLQACQDLIGIYFFMYYVQVGLNLREEWKIFTDKSSSEVYTPEIIPIPFGIESESAGMGRAFVTIWEGERGAPFSVKNDIFDSFAKLSVLNILNEAIQAEHPSPPEYALTLTEAQNEMDSKCREKAINDIYANLSGKSAPDQATSENLIRAAKKLIVAIDKNYRDADDIAPRSMGIRGVKRLADADVRYLKRERGRPGFRFQMADETLSFFARVFAWDETRSEGHQTFKQFVEYLKQRGFKLDATSERAAKDSLKSMGLLEQESDSGKSVNVRKY